MFYASARCLDVRECGVRVWGLCTRSSLSFAYLALLLNFDCDIENTLCAPVDSCGREQINV